MWWYDPTDEEHDAQAQSQLTPKEIWTELLKLNKDKDYWEKAVRCRPSRINTPAVGTTNLPSEETSGTAFTLNLPESFATPPTSLLPQTSEKLRNKPGSSTQPPTIVLSSSSGGTALPSQPAANPPASGTGPPNPGRSNSAPLPAPSSHLQPTPQPHASNPGVPGNPGSGPPNPASLTTTHPQPGMATRKISEPKPFTGESAKPEDRPLRGRNRYLR